METLYINLFMKLCLVILPAVNYIHSLEDEHDMLNYKACVKGGLDMEFTDGNRGTFTFYLNNTLSSTICKHHCNSLKYKLAGTKDYFCFCADGIRNDPILVTCDQRCPGDENEVCGGIEGISVINTGFRNTETTERETTTVTENTSESEMYTRNQSSTEIPSSQNLITNGTTVRNTYEIVSYSREKREGISTATVAYITVPVVIVMAGAIALVIYLIVRRKRAKRECNVSYHTNGSKHKWHTSEVDTNLGNENLLENHVDNKLCSKQPTEENPYSSAVCGTEYSTVSSADGPQAAHIYGCLKSKPGMNPTKSTEYAHMTVTKANSNPKFTDNTYAHIGNDKALEHSTENDPETVSTYNTLQASSAKHVADKVCKSESHQYPLYDHAAAGIGNKMRNNADEYAHLNSVKANVTSSKGNNKRNYVCEAIESQETVMYEKATHNYFILEPKK